MDNLIKSDNITWDQFWIDMASFVATKSKDSSTKVGCVIIGQDNTFLSMGFNGFPRGIIETEESWNIAHPTHNFDRWERPAKYSWVEHAERNAVYNAAREGIKLKGAKAYLNWTPHPCAECTRAFIQAGVVEIIGPNINFTGKGTGVNYSLDYAEIMCKEAGIKQTIIDTIK